MKNMFEQLIRVSHASKSIHRRFAILFSLVFFLFAILFVGIFGAFKYQTEGARLLGHYTSFVHAQSEVLADSIWHLDTERLDVILRAVVAEEGIVSASVYDEHGILLSSNTNSGHAADGNIISITSFINVDFTEINQVIGRLDVEYSDRELFEELRRSAILELGFSAILLLGGLTIAASVNRHAVVAPIRDLVSAVNNPRKGAERVRVKWQANDEIGKLVDAFNRMQALEEESEKKLREAQERLEDRVRERTEALALAVHEAEEANRAKSDFLASMSHELRTPLNAISGISEMLTIVDSLRNNDDKLLEYLNDIRFSAQHLNSLVDDVLDLAKIEAGRLDLNPELFVISPVISDVVHSLSVTAQQMGTSIVADPQETDVFVFADKRAIRQVLLNLVGNSIRHGGRGLRVQISLEYSADKDQVMIGVEDNGRGIPEEFVKAIGQPFIHSQTPYVRQNIDEDTQGTGLGLSIVTELVNASNGTLEVKSEVGRGTKVVFTLPVAEPDSKPE